ncbi:MAG: phosphopantothenoylcysteine decarboxylase [Myxococcota bacterium]|nr:phosphopantothenoylcysteine decarboxylase [Myxococcota bacterium]
MGRRIALLVTGGIAAMLAPQVARALRRRGATVVPFISQEAARYVARDALAWSADHPVIDSLGPRAEHLSDSAPFDAWLIAPATYNTINKAAAGVADGLIGAVLASAIGRVERGDGVLLIAPTMHGSMHNSILERSLHQLRALGAQLITPRPGYGKHNLPRPEVLAAVVCRALSCSPLRGHRLLITGGPTPVALDNVRRLGNRFTGRLATEIAEALLYAGAEVELLLGRGAITPPAHIPFSWVDDYESYRARILERVIGESPPTMGIFSAAVADYQPSAVEEGKIPSGRARWQLELAPTEKVIDLARAAAPGLFMVTFKYQEGMSHEALLALGEERLKRYEMVIVNRGEEKGPAGEQIAWLLRRGHPPLRGEGKKQIAKQLRAALEAALMEQTRAD